MTSYTWPLRILTLPFAACVVLAPAGCSDSDGRNAAAIYQHLSTAAPSGLQHGSWSDVTIDVVATTQRGGGLQDVTFHAYFAADESLAADRERGPGFTVLMKQQKGSPSIVRYGPELRETVAALVVQDWEARYGVLYETLDRLHGIAYPIWRPWMSARKKLLLRPLPEEQRRPLIDELEAGPPLEVVRMALEQQAAASSERVEWGLYHSGKRTAGMVLWVGDPVTSQGVCARRFGQPTDDDYAWIQGAGPTCRVPGGTFAPTHMAEAALRLIDGAGGAYDPRISPALVAALE